MIIVPTFAEGHEGKEPIVAAGVRGLVPARTEEVRERIDGEGVVPQQSGAQAEAPEKKREAARKEKHHGEDRRRNEIIFVEPTKFGESCEVANVIKVCVNVFVGDDPAEMRPEKSEECGRVKVGFLV